MSTIKKNDTTKDIQQLIKKLELAHTNHVGGWPALMDLVKEIAKENLVLTFRENNNSKDIVFYDYIHDKHLNYLRDICEGRTTGQRYSPSLIIAIEYCIDKIDGYLKKQHEVNAEKDADLLAKIKDRLKRKFFLELQNHVKECLVSRRPFEFIKEYARSIHIKGDEVIEFIVGNPTLLFSFIDKDYKFFKEGKRETPLVSNIYNFNTESEVDLFVEATEDFDDYLNGGKEYDKELRVELSKLKPPFGLFLAHALSPHSDSICLLYELGRFKRNADLYKAPHKIFLTAPSWAKYNRSAIEVHDDESNRVKILKQCLAFREKLYKQLSIEVDKTDESDVRSMFGTNEINHSRIKQSAKEFAEYSKYIYKIKVDEHANKEKQLLNIIENLCNTDNSDTYIDKLPPELKILAYSIVEDKKNLFMIHTTLKHFNNLDENTFYYTLLQRYKQQEYNGWTKLAVESERKFDASFIKLDKVDGCKTYNMGAIYYKHYYFARGKDRKPLNVIPYTFPSGRVWRRAGGKLEDAINQVILIWDYEGSRKDKILNIVNKMDLKQLAIQMSDLFSFCNYFFAEEFWEGKTDKQGQHQSGMNDLLNKLDPYCAIVWDKYRKNPDLLKTFCQYFLTMWYGEMDLPYYFYPFMHIQEAEKDKNHEIIVREVYAEVIIYVLNQLINIIPCSEWK